MRRKIGAPGGIKREINNLNAKAMRKDDKIMQMAEWATRKGKR